MTRTRSNRITRNTFLDLPDGFPINPAFNSGETTDYDFVNDPLFQGSYGVYLDGAGAFVLEENLFDIQDHTARTGSIVRRNGAMPNTVYLNTFQNLETGARFLDSNRGTQQGSGLQVKCNDFIDNVRDMEINAATSGSNIGIATPQGQFSPPNTFISPSNFLNQLTPALDADDVYNWTNSLHTYYYVQNELIPFECAGINTQVVTSQSTCYSNLFWNESNSSSKAYNSSELLAVDNTLNEIVDGGDSELLLSEILQTQVGEAYELYTNLLQDSPNLSEAAMIELIQKEVEIPAVLLTEILTNNPQAAKSEKVQQKLDERNALLTEQMREEINTGLDWNSLKENLEAERNTILSNLFRLMQEEIFTSTAHLPDTLTDSPGVSEIIDSYPISSVPENLNFLPSGIELGTWLENQLSNAVDLEEQADLLSLLELAELEDEGIDTLNTEDTAWLTSLVYGNDANKALLAQSILASNGHQIYERSNYLRVPIESRSTSEKKRQLQVAIKIFPNPCSEYFAIDTDNYILSQSSEWILRDNTGRVMKKGLIHGAFEVVDCSEITPGLYQLHIVDEKYLILNKSLIISK